MQHVKLRYHVAFTWKGKVQSNEGVFSSRSICYDNPT
jgi:hypothetical protein